MSQVLAASAEGKELSADEAQKMIQEHAATLNRLQVRQPTLNPKP
jgi:hypothetical protein